MKKFYNFILLPLLHCGFIQGQPLVSALNALEDKLVALHRTLTKSEIGNLDLTQEISLFKKSIENEKKYLNKHEQQLKKLKKEADTKAQVDFNVYSLDLSLAQGGTIPSALTVISELNKKRHYATPGMTQTVINLIKQWKEIIRKYTHLLNQFDFKPTPFKNAPEGFIQDNLTVKDYMKLIKDQSNSATPHVINLLDRYIQMWETKEPKIEDLINQLERHVHDIKSILPTYYTLLEIIEMDSRHKATIDFSQITASEQGFSQLVDLLFGISEINKIINNASPDMVQRAIHVAEDVKKIFIQIKQFVKESDFGQARLTGGSPEFRKDNIITVKDYFKHMQKIIIPHDIEGITIHIDRWKGFLR